MDKWQTAQAWESSWWNDCTNTLAEELKQIEYSRRMGLTWDGSHIEMQGESILDIGGGPVSLLLKTENASKRVVIDPCSYPDWTLDRYKVAGIDFIRAKGEDIDKLNSYFDEIWLYNCLQHVDNPEEIIVKAKTMTKKIRIFEWINIPENIGHLHVLTAENLNKWLGKTGRIEELSSNGCYGNAYFGVFEYNNNEQI